MSVKKKDSTTQPAPDIPVTGPSKESGSPTQEITQHSVIYSSSGWTFPDSARPA